MRNVRVFFKKEKECRYISHLDLNRVMLRALQKSAIPVWRTEGFHQHAYITFALPLSLGFSSKKESMDFRLLDDEMDLDEIPQRLNECLPTGLEVISCAEAKHKPAAITQAAYSAIVRSDDISSKELYSIAESLLAQDEILVEKKTKKKKRKTVDLKPYFDNCALEEADDALVLRMRLPAGSVTNINPTLFLNLVEEKSGNDLVIDVTREEIFIEGGEPFE